MGELTRHRKVKNDKMWVGAAVQRCRKKKGGSRAATGDLSGPLARGLFGLFPLRSYEGAGCWLAR